jgi:hypothetical protein
MLLTKPLYPQERGSGARNGACCQSWKPSVLLTKPLCYSLNLYIIRSKVAVLETEHAAKIEAYMCPHTAMYVS